MGGGCLERLTALCDGRPWCRALLAFASLQGLDDAHGLPHSIRVLCRALRLLEEDPESYPGADVEVVVAAALLHDVGRPLERLTGQHHAVLSARLAAAVLESTGFPAEKVGRVLDAIASHSYSGGGGVDSPEACLLRDADRLDALGALGYARMIYHGCVIGRGIADAEEHYREKLVRLPETLCGALARREARVLLERLERVIEMVSEELQEYREAVEYAVSLLKPSPAGGGGVGGRRGEAVQASSIDTRRRR